MTNQSNSTKSPLWKVSPRKEVNDELAFHVEMRTREYIADGLSPEDARAKALERFGDSERHRSDCQRLAQQRNRRLTVAEALRDLGTDLRFALRQFSRHPAFAAALLLTLTFGVGINLAGFSILQNALLAPLPFAQPEQIISIWEQNAPRSNTKNVVGPANFMEWRDQSETFQDFTAFITFDVTLQDADVATRAKARLVTDGFFDVFKAKPALGRSLDANDYTEEASYAVVLTHSFWQQRFAGRPDVLAQILTVNGQAREIVGVMPESFDLDLGPGTSGFGQKPDFYTQMPINEQWRTHRGRYLLTAGRLADGVTVEQARAEMDTISLRLQEKFPEFDNGWSAQLEPMSEHQQSLVKQSTLTLFGAVGLLLLVVAVNVASLLVARAGLRGDEVSVRLALGAGRSRLVRQIFAEGALMAFIGGVGGVAIAWMLLRVVRPFMPTALAGSSEISLGGPLMLYSLLLVLGSTLLFGMAPAWHVLRGRHRTGRKSVGGSVKGQRLRSAMVFAETALAAVLLVVAGLLLRSLISMTTADTGFERDRVLTANLAIPRGSSIESAAFFRDLLDQAAALPGVTKAGAVSSIPIAGPGAATNFWPLDRPETPVEERQVADIRIVRGDYLEALNVPLIEGRTFDERDHDEAATVVLISQQVADLYWPQGGAVGQELHVQWDTQEPRRVIGVVGDVQNAGLTTPARNTIYLAHEQEGRGTMTVTLRTDGRADLLVAPLRQLVSELAPTVPLADVLTLDDAVTGSVAQERFVLKGVVLFAVLSLVLAALGLYSVTSYSAAQRRPEIALRMALGAGPGEIRGLVFQQAGRLVAAGLVAGLGLAVLAGRGLESQLYEVQARDPLTFGVVAVVLAVAAGVAVLVPAVRAAGGMPGEVLREG